MQSYNIANLSPSKRASIELHKSALFADFNMQRLTVEEVAIITAKRFECGKIDRASVKKLIDASMQSDKLKGLINQYIKER